MPRAILLDTFPLSSTSKKASLTPSQVKVSDQCQQWVFQCIAAGNLIYVPCIAYYEAVRELERLDAAAQIARLSAFCDAVPGRFISINDDHIKAAAKLWARSRNAGTPTASADALDGDVILAAQALSLGLPASDYVIATTNVGHLAQFVPADLWQNIQP